MVERERMGSLVEDLPLPAKGRLCKSRGRVAILAQRPVVILRGLVAVRALVHWRSRPLVAVVTPHFSMFPF
jgi:hypothetical protein